MASNGGAVPIGIAAAQCAPSSQWIGTSTWWFWGWGEVLEEASTLERLYSQIIVQSVKSREWKNSHHKDKSAQAVSLTVPPSLYPQPLPSISGQSHFLKVEDGEDQQQS